MFRIVIAFFTSILLATAPISDAFGNEAYSDTEARVRAAILFGILRFTYWPDSHSPIDNIRICVSGNSPIAASLSSMPSIPQIGSHKVTIEDLQADSSQLCHAHIVGNTTTEPNTPTYGALLICDNCRPEHTQKAAIDLHRVGDVVRFDINIDKLEAHGIELSASVIKLADRCSSSNPEIRGCNDN